MGEGDNERQASAGLRAAIPESRAHVTLRCYHRLSPTEGHQNENKGEIQRGLENRARAWDQRWRRERWGGGSREREMQMRMSKPSPDCSCVPIAYVVKGL